MAGSKEQIQKLWGVVETLLLYPETFVNLDTEPPKGVLPFGPQVQARHSGLGQMLTGPMLAFRAIGFELLQNNVGEGA